MIVMKKAIAQPTESRVYHRSRERLVKLTKRESTALRQSYTRKGKETLAEASRYGYARQFKRPRRETKCSKTWLGRVVRDIERKIADRPAQQTIFVNELALARRPLTQQRRDKRKLYSVYAPEVERIRKGKVRKPFEFGVEVSVATTSRGNFKHTLSKTLLCRFETSDQVVRQAFVGQGYRSCSSTEYVRLFLAGQRSGMTQVLKCEPKRHDATEPIIGHMKAESHLNQNYLKGAHR